MISDEDTREAVRLIASALDVLRQGGELSGERVNEILAKASVGESVYGYCPVCGAAGVARERRIHGDDICARGHHYFSSSALTDARDAAERRDRTNKL